MTGVRLGTGVIITRQNIMIFKQSLQVLSKGHYHTLQVSISHPGNLSDKVSFDECTYQPYII